jgi:O-antigen/teichoic acid export membrane protein
VGTRVTEPPATVSEAVRREEEEALRRRVRRGSYIELFGFGSSQALRLATNLVLSRLLFPEAYGLTAIATVYMVALHMLTDVGLRDSIINNARGEDERFINTVWTLQVARGFGLWFVAAASAWPVAWIYGDEQLGPLIIASSFVTVIYGFASTAPHTLSRRLERMALLKQEIASKVLSMIVMFVWAWVHPSVWALVAGAATQAVCETVFSHILLPVGYKNRFCWDREAAREIGRFGKWIFGSSTFTFLAGEGDRLLLGRLLSMASLGIYSMAGMLASAVGIAVGRLSTSVLYGLLSTVVREKPGELARHYYAARLKMDIVAMPLLGALMVLGPLVVQILYDERYADAGWMLQILSIRVALQCTFGLAGVCLLTLNRPHYHVHANAGRFLAVWGGIPIGNALGGVEGVVWATALSEIPAVAVFTFGLWRAGVLRVWRELIAPVGVLIGAGAAYGLLHVLRLCFPAYVGG